MRIARKALFAGAAAACLLAAGGLAAAESAKLYTMTVRTPDGATATIRYAGDTAPKVTFSDNPFLAHFWGVSIPFAAFAQIQADMDRQMEAVLRQADTMSKGLASDDGLFNVGLGDMPKGGHGYSFFSSTNGACTRSVEITSDGAGKRNVERHVSGDCGKEKPAAKTDKDI